MHQHKLKSLTSHFQSILPYFLITIVAHHLRYIIYVIEKFVRLFVRSQIYDLTFRFQCELLILLSSLIYFANQAYP